MRQFNMGVPSKCPKVVFTPVDPGAQVFVFQTNKGKIMAWDLTKLDKAKATLVQYPVIEWFRKNGIKQLHDGMMNPTYAASIDLTQADPIMVVSVENPEAPNGVSHIVADGNHRLLKAAMMGVQDAPCLLFDVEESKKAELDEAKARFWWELPS